MTRQELEARAARMAVDAKRVSASIRCHDDGRHAASQLLRAAASTASNYRASGHARSRREFVAKLGVVLEEADETVYWLQYAIATDLVAASAAAALMDEARQLAAIFAASYRTARRNLRRRDEGQVE